MRKVLFAALLLQFSALQLTAALPYKFTALKLNDTVLPEDKPAKSGEKPFRRAEVIFFIALPFAMLYSTALMKLAESNNLQEYPDKRLFDREFFFVNRKRIFLMANSVLWAGNISYNDLRVRLKHDGGASWKAAYDSTAFDFRIYRRDF